MGELAGDSVWQDASKEVAGALGPHLPHALIGPIMTLSTIVLWAKRLKDWNTIPTSARSLASSSSDSRQRAVRPLPTIGA